MRRTLTDADMLRAATRALDAHLATRPATAAEALSIATAYEAQALSLRNSASDYRAQNTPILDVGHGVTVRAPWGRSTALVQAALSADQQALQASSHATAWQQIATTGDAAWLNTLADLRGRLAFYAARVA